MQFLLGNVLIGMFFCSGTADSCSGIPGALKRKNKSSLTQKAFHMQNTKVINFLTVNMGIRILINLPLL